MECDMSVESVPCVRVLALNGEWEVTISEERAKVVQRFDHEAHARSFAAGQCIRLGLSITAPSNLEPDYAP